MEIPDLTAFTEDAFAKLTTGRVPNKEKSTDGGSQASRKPGKTA